MSFGKQDRRRHKNIRHEATDSRGARAALLVAPLSCVILLLGFGAQGQGAYEYVGARRCIACHIKQFRSWGETAMSQAYWSLGPGVKVEAKLAAGLDPEQDYSSDATCLECHVTGWGESGGFTSITETPNLAGVTCEACHGPGSEYIKPEVMGLENKDHTFAEVIAAGLTYPVPEEVCLRCHNERSPHNAALDPEYAFEYSRETLGAATHEHTQLAYDHGPLPPGVLFQEGR